jgi:hypothetical protein
MCKGHAVNSDNNLNWCQGYSGNLSLLPSTGCMTNTWVSQMGVCIISLMHILCDTTGAMSSPWPGKISRYKIKYSSQLCKTRLSTALLTTYSGLGLKAASPYSPTKSLTLMQNGLPILTHQLKTHKSLHLTCPPTLQTLLLGSPPVPHWHLTCHHTSPRKEGHLSPPTCSNHLTSNWQANEVHLWLIKSW